MNLQKVQKLLKNSSDKLKPLSGSEVNESRLAHISGVFADILGVTSKIGVGLIYQSCLHLLYTTPDDTEIRETLRRVLANDQYIWHGMSIPVWGGDPVRVTIGVARAKEMTIKGRKRVEVYFRVLDGIPAGLMMGLTIPSWWSVRVIKRKLGMFKSPIQPSPVDIAGTTFSVKLRSVGDRGAVTWEDISATAKQKELNKGLIYARYESRPCGSSEPCCRCSYTRRQCPLAVL